MGKMYSSVDIHKDLRETRKLQITAREFKPKIGTSSLNPISKINHKYVLGTMPTSGVNQNNQKQLNRFLINNVNEPTHKNHNSLPRKNEKNDKFAMPFENKSSFKSNAF